MTCSRVQWMRITCCLLLLFITQASMAETTRRLDPEYIFYKASAFYENAKYEEAIAQYSLLLEQGLESGPLYYNLGNCYLKKGELGRAILSYERAKRIIPRDSDLESNAEYAKSLVRENLRESRRIWYDKIADRIFKPISINDLTILLSVAYLLFMMIFIASLYLEPLKRSRKILFSIFVLILIIGGFGLYQKIAILDKEAIIIVEKSEAKFEPFDRSTTHFTLYEGMKVQVLFSKKEWVKIKWTDRKVGWVKASSIEMI